MNNKYYEIAVGWLRQSEKRGEYVSAIAAKGNPKTNKPSVSKITISYDNGESIDITSFAMFFNENKKHEKAPDVQFVATVSE